MIGIYDCFGYGPGYEVSFEDVYSRKREALEFIIQREMKVEGCKSFIPFRVISRVYYNGEVKNPKIEYYAKQIMKKVIEEIPFVESKVC